MIVFEKPAEMELELIRSYFPAGTNGELFYNGKRICFMIELPWLHNEPLLSCIPEGRYELVKRFSAHHQWHLMLKGVSKRSLILIHCANDAMKELNGCIAPVSILTAEGKGLRSRIARDKLHAIVYLNWKKRTKFLSRLNRTSMNLSERVQSPTPDFFKKLRNIGLVLAAISGTVLTAPVALPVVVLKGASYLAVASMVASAVSQTAVQDEPNSKKVNESNGP